MGLVGSLMQDADLSPRYHPRTGGGREIPEFFMGFGRLCGLSIENPYCRIDLGNRLFNASESSYLAVSLLQNR